MTTYSYSAVDIQGKPARGTMQAAGQSTVILRIKEMGLFPLKIREQPPRLSMTRRLPQPAGRMASKSQAATRPGVVRAARVKPKVLAILTRQLATLLEAGVPLLRGLRLLHEQEESRRLKAIIGAMAVDIEGGDSFSEALARFSRVFNPLYLNLAKAGEISGSLELALRRLADFMEKSGHIKGRVKAGLFYPAAVMTVALGVMALMLVFIVPRFKEIFGQLSPDHSLPGFTLFVLGISDLVRHNFLIVLAVLGAVWFGGSLAIRTRAGRGAFDLAKLHLPVLGPVFRKLAVARVTRTFGTLVTSGVPILQALTIVKEAAGNVIVGRLAERVRESVEQGESVTGPLRGSAIFPPMVVGMIDVGEETGALPEMLNRIADNYDEEVDNAVQSMTSLLEPIMIVFLGVVVGCIVVAMFLPIICFTPEGDQGGSP
jgi:type IV pilus assembly protein PilC